MRNKFKLNRIFWISLIFVSGSIILYSNIAPVKPPKINDFSKMNVEKQIHTKIESALYKLADMYFNKGIEEAKKYAGRREIEMKGNRVRLVAEAKAWAVRTEAGMYTLRKQIETFGGTAELNHQNLFQILMPLDTLQDFANLDTVKYLRLPIKPVSFVESEGLQTTNAVQWQDIPSYRTGGEKVKVCILDLGFEGYESLLGSELPNEVVTKSFRTDGDISAGKHGTACAEIVHDMAPDAELYLVNFSNSVQHHNAVTWIINQDIDIVSYSIGWKNIGAGNGTGPICEDVERASENGIIWVSAAGNDAKYHWGGRYRDSDGDNWHNFQGSDEVLTFYVNSYTPVSVYLNWNDWGSWNGSTYAGSNQDYDLYLWHWDGATWRYVARSNNSQTGYQWPVEGISGWYSSRSSYWGVTIQRYDSNRDVSLELFVRGTGSEIKYNQKYGSLTIPADSPDAVAVGATDWANDYLHSYSSWGPTTDKRVKPDFTAPAGVSGMTYGNLGFFGTSAATPHVAGAFALLKGKTPYSLSQIKMILEPRALDLGPAGKDNRYGLGRLDLNK